MGVAIFVLGPTGDLATRAVNGTSSALTEAGLPRWVTEPGAWEFVYNIALFVPVAAVCATLWPRVPVLGWTLLGLLGSVAIEVVQALVLPGRTSEIEDLAANTLGALLGAALARWAWRAFEPPDSVDTKRA